MAYCVPKKFAKVPRKGLETNEQKNKETPAGLPARLTRKPPTGVAEEKLAGD